MLETQLAATPNAPRTPFIYYRTPAPPLTQIESGESQPLSPIRNGTKLPPLPFFPSKEDSLFDLNWKPPKGSHLVNPNAYHKALDRAYGFLHLPPIQITPPEELRKRFAHALSVKTAFAEGLADAERKCHVSESALHQALGETEVQKIANETSSAPMKRALPGGST